MQITHCGTSAASGFAGGRLTNWFVQWCQQPWQTRCGCSLAGPASPSYKRGSGSLYDAHEWQQDRPHARQWWRRRETQKGFVQTSQEVP